MKPISNWNEYKQATKNTRPGGFIPVTKEFMAELAGTSGKEQVLLSGSLWWFLGCVLLAMALGALLAFIVCLAH